MNTQKRTACLLLFVLPLSASANDLLSIYNEATQTNGTYLAAKATYQAASYGVPIARAGLLPNVGLSANTTANRQSPEEPGGYNSNGYTLTLTQPLFNLGNWYTYTQSEATYQSAAITFAEAEQSLIMTVATDYFAVLEAMDQLKYAKANQDALQEQLVQTKAQYTVGLKALTDVESTDASYQSAVASTLAAQSTLDNAYQTLAAVTGRPEKDLAPLKQTFPLLKPDPADMNAWVQFGLKNNLTLQQAIFQSEIDRLGITVAETTGYAPTINAVGTYANTNSNDTIPPPTQRTINKSAALNLSWTLFSGLGTVATVKQTRYTYQGAVANQEQTKRQTDAAIQQAYLNVLSDISQVQAFEQAVISGQASLRSMRAGYLVGTRTIVDVLTQQSNLYSSEQQYAQSIYNYITDSLTLKQQAGLLNSQDVAAINTWLVPVK